MLKLNVHIELDNDAFEDSNELPRILHELAETMKTVDIKAEKLSAFDRTTTLFDANGNKVGQAKFTGARWL